MLPIYAFFGGFFVKVLTVIIRGFQKNDIWAFLIALAIGTYGFLRGVEYGYNFALVAFFVCFVGYFAFALKGRIVPMITEATLLFYGLLGLYLYITTDAKLYAHNSILIALILFSCVAFLLCITKFRAPGLLQVVLVCCYLLTSVAILFQFVNLESFQLICEPTCSAQAHNPVTMFFAGYSFFHIISGILFVLYFIPIPLSKRESIRERIQNIKEHASFFEKRYVDNGLNLSHLIAVVVLGLILFGNGVFGIVDSALVVSFAITVENLISPKSQLASESPVQG